MGLENRPPARVAGCLLGQTMRQYLDLMQHILEHGVQKPDRTGTGTRSVFGYQMRFDLRQGFPLLTTKRLYLRAILYEMSIPAANNVAEMFDQAVEQLRLSGRPLILDEADHLAKNSCMEMVRGLMDKSRVCVVLSGEELLMKKLERWERVHSRILKPVAAQPADANDLRVLAKLYCTGVAVGQDWLDELMKQTGGNTRRVVVNLNRARNEAAALGTISLQTWGERGWYTGHSPAPRKAV